MIKLSRDDRLDGTALLVMRLGLAWFLFLWAAHKIITPGQYQQLARHFDNVDLSLWQVYTAGGIQIAICACVALGIFRYAAYGTILIMHGFTVARRWDRFLDPFALNEHGFPINRNPVIDLAVLGAMIALVLLIRRDHFSVGGWLNRHSGARWWL